MTSHWQNVNQSPSQQAPHDKGVKPWCSFECIQKTYETDKQAIPEEAVCACQAPEETWHLWFVFKGSEDVGK